MRFLSAAFALNMLAVAAAAQGVVMPKASPDASLTQQIGTANVTIKYSRPGVKGREVWGSLVPYDEVWRAGANAATTIEFSDAVTINDKAVPAGKYAFFAIPKKGAWTLILSKNPVQSGAFQYKESEDLMRFEAKPEEIPMVEWLAYTVTPEGKNSGIIALNWEKMKVAFKITADVSKAVKMAADAAMKKEDTKKDDRFYRTWAQAYFDNDVDLAQALSWIDESIKIKEGVSNTTLKGRILGKLGKRDEGVKCIDRAVALAKEAKMKDADIEEIQKIAAEIKARN